MPLAMLLLQLAGVVPSLMKYAGAGDTAEKVATQAIEIAKTVTGLSDPQEAVNHIVTNPAAANDFTLAVNKQMMDWDKMFIDDVANARSRDVELHKLGDNNKRANWMITLDAVGLLACLVVLSTYNENLSEGVITIITTIASIFGLCLRDAHQFEFGASRSSQAAASVAATAATVAAAKPTGTGS